MMTISAMPITNWEVMQTLDPSQVWCKNKGILVLLVWVTWYVPNSGRKSEFCYYIVPIILIS